MRHTPRFALFLPLFCLLLSVPGWNAAAYSGERTYDTLSVQENSELTRLEGVYFSRLQADALKLVNARFDLNTLLRTFPEQIRILQQRNRAQYLDVERYLYSLRLNPEFVEGFMRTMKEDAVLHAMDAIVQKSRAYSRGQ